MERSERPGTSLQIGNCTLPVRERPPFHTIPAIMQASVISEPSTESSNNSSTELCRETHCTNHNIDGHKKEIHEKYSVINFIISSPADSRPRKLSP